MPASYQSRGCSWANIHGFASYDQIKRFRDEWWRVSKALVSAAQLSGAQSARSFGLSASAAQILNDERWARAHHKITECERKLALISERIWTALVDFSFVYI